MAAHNEVGGGTELGSGSARVAAGEEGEVAVAGTNPMLRSQLATV